MEGGDKDWNGDGGKDSVSRQAGACEVGVSSPIQNPTRPRQLRVQQLDAAWQWHKSIGSLALGQTSLHCGSELDPLAHVAANGHNGVVRLHQVMAWMGVEEESGRETMGHGIGCDDECDDEKMKWSRRMRRWWGRRSEEGESAVEAASEARAN